MKTEGMRRQNMEAEEELGCRKFHAVKVEFMVGGEDRDTSLVFPFLSNCGK